MELARICVPTINLGGKNNFLSKMDKKSINYFRQFFLHLHRVLDKFLMIPLLTHPKIEIFVQFISSKIDYFFTLLNGNKKEVRKDGEG